MSTDALLAKIESQIDRNAVGRTAGLKAVADLRAMLAAAQAAGAEQTQICGACGQPWTGEPCGQKDNGHPFLTCYPVPNPGLVAIEVKGFAAGIEAAGQRIRDGRLTFRTLEEVEQEVRALRPPSCASEDKPAPGWKLVPIEPTSEMKDAGYMRVEDEVDPGLVWEAMVKAAPPSASAPAGAPSEPTRDALAYLAQHFIVKDGPRHQLNQYEHLEFWWAAKSVDEEPDAGRNPWLMIAAAESSYSLVAMGELAGIINEARTYMALLRGSQNERP